MIQKKQDKTKIVQIWGDILDEGFTSVPNILLRYRNNLEIKPQHLALIIDIMSFKWDSENPFPSYSTLARRAGVSERSIKRTTQDLEELNLLKRTPRFDKETGAQITTVFDFRPLIKKLTEQIKKDKKTNIIDNKYVMGEGDKYVMGGVSQMSPEGVINMSPKEYTYINKTNINKNPNKEEEKRVHKYFRNGVFRNRIFETFDNLYKELTTEELVLEGSYRACREIITNKVNKLSNEKININPSKIANNVKNKFPYKDFPKKTNNARKFFVAKICDITSKEILNYL